MALSLSYRPGSGPLVARALCATAAPMSQLRPRKARSHPPPPPFSPRALALPCSPRTHHPQGQSPRTHGIRVYMTYSPSRAFADRMRRSLDTQPRLSLSASTSASTSTCSPSSCSPVHVTAATATTTTLTGASTASIQTIATTSRHPIARRQAATGPTMGATSHQTRGHAGHSHHHHHDNVYLTSQNKSDPGVRITRIGLYSNLGMAIAKGVGGYMFNSQAMIADAWHSLTDLASDILTLATVSWSLRPPSANFPLGFGKVESLGSLGVSGMLLVGGIFMCVNSLETLYLHFFLDPSEVAEALSHGHGHGHSHGGHSHGAGIPSLHAAWLAAGTVVVKEWLYHATMRVAVARKSSVLASNAIHHRVDSLTGIVTLLAILGANMLSSAAWLDPIGGLFIALLVIRAGFGNTLSALYELADRSIDDEVRRSVTKHANGALTDLADGSRGLVELRDVGGVKSGQNYLLDLELLVPGSWSVEQVRAVEEAVRERVGTKVRGARRIRIRFTPKGADTGGLEDEFVLPGEASPRSSPEPEDHDHHHEHDHDHDHKKGL